MMAQIKAIGSSDWWEPKTPSAQTVQDAIRAGLLSGGKR